VDFAEIRAEQTNFSPTCFAAERPCLTGAADFESALGQVLRKWQSSVSVEVALRLWTEIEPAADILDLALRNASLAGS
jgi:hypothetical protein